MAEDRAFCKHCGHYFEVARATKRAAADRPLTCPRCGATVDSAVKGGGHVHR